MSETNHLRRSLLKYLGLAGGSLVVAKANAHHTESHFEDTTAHNIVYQCNQADAEYHRHILFSAGELLRTYGDDIQIIVAAFGPGIHILGKKPGRPVAADVRQKVSSLAEYGIGFHACGNTMKTLNWSEKDMLAFAHIVPVGVIDIMLLQEKGFSYFSW